MIAAIAIILSFQLGGEILSRALNLSLPGPVLAMIVLVGACQMAPGLADRLRPVTSVLLANLSLLFVPAGVGVVGYVAVFREHGPGLALAIIVSTALAIAAGALAFELVARLTGSHDND